MKKLISKTTFFMAFLMIALFCATPFVGAEPINWYCARNGEHKQPRLGADLAIIDRYGGFYIDRAHGDDSEEKVVYLTFDAGYENGNVEKILDVLREQEVTGAFFILENLITKNTDLVKRMAQEGHTVCNHTCRHKDMTRVASIDEFAQELKKLEDIYREYTGDEMAKYYRPPEGRFDEKTLEYADKLGYKTVFWSLAYADWDNGKQPSREFALKKLGDNMHNGAVILLHPTSATNAAILGEFIETLKSQGYRFGSLDELVASNIRR